MAASMSGISQVNIAAASTVSDDPQVQLALAGGFQLIHILQVYTSSMMALAVWDWMVCARMEWYRIWKREWSAIKCLYIWTRYYGIACFAVNLWLFNAEFTIEQCKTLHYLIAATCMWVTLGSEAILAIRTYAFLGKKLWVGILMSVMLLGETAFLLYVSIAAVYQIPPPIGDRGPCTASDKPGKHVVSGFWLAPVVFDLICTAMTVGKSWKLRDVGVRSGLVSIFVREGIFYFIAVAGVNVLNAAFMIQSSNPSLQNINCYLALVLSQVLCCRLVLNLRSQTDQSTTHTTSESHPSFAVSASRNPPNYSIPLKKYRGAAGMKSQDAHSDDLFDGVKVQVSHPRDFTVSETN
ncbi:hypothetical protein D9756_001678 [Leucocoprinus leucothites]|uniref:DUF6533 domain-containing protein n=1 Tax=Leucocoprinus leucothites TaxID=201217 RepID=A0A8H5G4Y3_9AGAR|nr:hypothetical protein D9756_001678 [Leucoagaricus leucothites]